MLRYIGRRILYMLVLVIAISVVAFFIISLPPGDFVDQLVTNFMIRGRMVTPEYEANLRRQYGMDRPLVLQYLRWASGVVRGDFGFSFQWSKPVNQVIWEKLGLSMLISLASIMFSFAVAIPIGVYSAARRYSVTDYVATVIGFLGLAIPNFLLGLLLMWFSHVWFGTDIGGLFSSEYQTEPWSWAKFANLLSHVWVAVVVVGTAGTAATIRVVRATTADELNRPYVTVARAKGLSEFNVVVRHTLRVAINPVISTVGWLLPLAVSGEAITAVVLGLPTTGTLLLGALLGQDMFLAGSLTLMLSVLTVIGTLLSDILLALSDPRIRLES